MAELETERLVLGKQVDYCEYYDPTQLCPIPREWGRKAAAIPKAPSFAYGQDIWNIYELSWLNKSGKPVVAMAEVRVPWQSSHLIESKSLKLYCNSFNMSCFASAGAVQDVMHRDLSHAAGAPVSVRIVEAKQFLGISLAEPEGICLDEQTIDGFSYAIDAGLLKTEREQITETLFSRLFRSRCPVTGQPDWATVRISYTGQRIEPADLLRYLVSYREHQGFHEACVERIHSDIMRQCTPKFLEVSARFTRRGGIDINPVRSTHQGAWENLRDPRQ